MCHNNVAGNYIKTIEKEVKTIPFVKKDVIPCTSCKELSGACFHYILLTSSLIIYSTCFNRTSTIQYIDSSCVCTSAV